MPSPRPWLDAREVDRIEALVAVNDGSRTDDFLARCIVGSMWTVHIRTADVGATVLARKPLGTFDEHVCTCLSLKLDLPVPVEPGLRFHLTPDEDESLHVSAVVRPWGAK